MTKTSKHQAESLFFWSSLSVMALEQSVGQNAMRPNSCGGKDLAAAITPSKHRH